MGELEESWLPAGATRDEQSITADWVTLGPPLIDGVTLHPVVNVLTGYGQLTELYRTDWELGGEVDQVFQSRLEPGAVSAWHAHGETTDRLFASTGQLLLVLYDARPGSPSVGQIDEIRIGITRPALIVVPPRVWHGVKNLGGEVAVLVNLVDRAYAYAEPDHYRLPPDAPAVPYDLVAAR